MGLQGGKGTALRVGLGGLRSASVLEFNCEDVSFGEDAASPEADADEKGGGTGDIDPAGELEPTERAPCIIAKAVTY